jgi:hypothetical protein
VSKTRHIQARMSQRGINQKMIKLACQFGVKQGEKIVLNRKGLDNLLVEIKEIQKTALKMRDKGGVVVIETSEQAQVTTYNLDSYKRVLH